MSSVSLTGSDAIQIDDQVLADLADGDAVKLVYPDDITVVKASKNGNRIYAFNETGRKVDCELRLLLGSFSDKYLNSRLQQQKNDLSGFTLITGVFSKRVGDGAGNIDTVVYQMSGGVVKKNPEAKTSAEGDTEQSVAIYTISFGNGDRSVQ